MFVNQRVMRQPIQRQLLWPMLQVVILGSAVTAMLAAWMNVRSARQAEELRLKQLASTLTDAGFPLTDAVLSRMSQLSGAHFVTLREDGVAEHASDAGFVQDGAKLAELRIDASLQAAFAHQELELSHGTYRAIRIPVRTAVPPQSLTLVILTSQQRWNEVAWQAALPPMIAGLLAASAATAFAVASSRRFVNRIHDLGRRAAELAAGRFECRPVPDVDDELRDLALALNTTGEQLQHYELQIRAGERLKTLGRLGAGMAHQLRNAITGARMALDLHAAESPASTDQESLEVAIRQLTLMESYLQRFLSLGRGELPQTHDVDLTALITDALPLVEPICRHHGITVHWQPATAKFCLAGDADALRQMLLNLLMNAIEAVQPLAASQRQIGMTITSSSDDVIQLECWDHGPGPSEVIAPDLFERFVTDKPDGTGLGLAVAKEIAEAHGGTITWRREQVRTVFGVSLPKRTANSPASGGAE